MTFDNKKFDFQGTCVYQLAALCSKDPELVPFEVLVQNDHRGHRVVSYTKLVEIKVHSLSIVITKTHKGLIMVRSTSFCVYEKLFLIFIRIQINISYG